MKELTIALVQMCSLAGDTDANAEKIISYMHQAADKGAELAVFPECSLSGYAPERAEELALSVGDTTVGAAELAISTGGGPISAVEKAADKLGIAVCFGFMERREGRLYISQEMYCGGERTVYRKTYPGSREAMYFEAGNKFPVSREPICCGMQLCWESHIPEISSGYRKQGAQLLLFPYASGMSGERCRDNWQVHLPARASDNGCFAAACNLLTKVPKSGNTCAPNPSLDDPDNAEDKIGEARQTGSETEAERRGGGLAVWDPKGRLIAQYFETEEMLLTAEIGGELPRERFLKEQQGLAEHDMHALSYFDLKREDLF